MSTEDVTRLEVTVPGGSYDVLVGAGILDVVGESIASRTRSRRCAVITDEQVAGLYLDRVERSLSDAGMDTDSLIVPAGEKSKDWETAGRLLEALSEAGLGRDSFIVALGGGVVGDLAGFVASTYLRGVPVVQVPTTLLAQTDSSVGGKTGVDLPLGKNLAGCFWQPMLVVADVGCLRSLPEREWSSGLAEVAKSAVLQGEGFFAMLERDAELLRVRDTEAVRRAVEGSIALKARVVSGDEREAADRECLNYGHTLAHAIERESGYGTISHGAAVADGIRFAARLAEDVIGSDAAWVERQEHLLDALGLHRGAAPCDPEDLLAAMRSDKKSRAGRVRFVLSSAPGRWTVEEVDDRVLLEALDEWCDRETGGDS